VRTRRVVVRPHPRPIRSSLLRTRRQTQEVVSASGRGRRWRLRTGLLIGAVAAAGAIAGKPLLEAVLARALAAEASRRLALDASVGAVRVGWRGQGLERFELRDPHGGRRIALVDLERSGGLLELISGVRRGDLGAWRLSGQVDDADRLADAIRRIERADGGEAPSLSMELTAFAVAAPAAGLASQLDGVVAFLPRRIEAAIDLRRFEQASSGDAVVEAPPWGAAVALLVQTTHGGGPLRVVCRIEAADPQGAAAATGGPWEAGVASARLSAAAIDVRLDGDWSQSRLRLDADALVTGNSVDAAALAAAAVPEAHGLAGWVDRVLPFVDEHTRARLAVRGMVWRLDGGLGVDAIEAAQADLSIEALRLDGLDAVRRGSLRLEASRNGHGSPVDLAIAASIPAEAQLEGRASWAAESAVPATAHLAFDLVAPQSFATAAAPILSATLPEVADWLAAIAGGERLAGSLRWAEREIALALRAGDAFIEVTAALAAKPAEGVLATLDEIAVRWDLATPAFDLAALLAAPLQEQAEWPRLVEGGRWRGRGAALGIDLAWPLEAPPAATISACLSSEVDLASRDGERLAIRIGAIVEGGEMRVELVDLADPAAPRPFESVQLIATGEGRRWRPRSVRVEALDPPQGLRLLRPDLLVAIAALLPLRVVSEPGRLDAAPLGPNGAWALRWTSPALDAEVRLDMEEAGAGDPALVLAATLAAVVPIDAEELLDLIALGDLPLVESVSGRGMLAVSGRGGLDPAAGHLEWSLEGVFEPHGAPLELRLAALVEAPTAPASISEIRLAAAGDLGTVRWSFAGASRDDATAEPALLQLSGVLGSGRGVRLEADVADLRHLERVLGAPGRLELGLGRRLSIRLDAGGEPGIGDPATPTTLVAEVEADLLRSLAPMVLEHASGAVQLAEAATLEWTIAPAFFARLLRDALPRRGVGLPLSLRTPVAVRISVAHAVVPIDGGLPDGLVFAASVEVPRTGARGPDREAIELQWARLDLDRLAGGPVRYRLEGEHAIGGAGRLALRRGDGVLGRFGIEGVFDAAQAQLQLRCEAVPTSLVRWFAGLGEIFDAAVGPAVDADLSAQRDGDGVRFDLRANSPQSSLEVAGRLDASGFVADGPLRARLERISPDLLAALIGGSGVLSAAAQLEGGAGVSVEATGLRVPAGRRAVRLDAAFATSPIEIVVRIDPALVRLLRVRGGALQAIRSDPIRGSIRRGVVQLEPFAVRIAELAVGIEGSIDLPLRSLDLVLEVPVDGLADAGTLLLTESIAATGAVRQVRGDLIVPIRIHGPFDAPRFEIDLDRLGEAALGGGPLRPRRPPDRPPLRRPGDPFSID